MTAALPLSPSLVTAAAAPLRDALLASIDGRTPVRIDGSAVERAGQACLQVLASARSSAASVGLSFEIEAPSEALEEAAMLAGLGHALGLGC